MEDKKVCCICGKEFTGYGYNPSPVKDNEGKDFPEGSVCCKECDIEFVTPLKINRFFESLDSELENR